MRRKLHRASVIAETCRGASEGSLLVVEDVGIKAVRIVSVSRDVSEMTHEGLTLPSRRRRLRERDRRQQSASREGAECRLDPDK